MRKVKDASGKVVDKIYRHPNGALVVDDKNGYAAYMMAKEKAVNTNKRVQSLESELSEVRTMLAQLMSKQGNSANG